MSARAAFLAAVLGLAACSGDDGDAAGRGTQGLCGTRGLQGAAITQVTSPVQGCGIKAPVRVTRVDGVRLSRPATLDCPTARALHRWVRRGLRPALGRRGGGPVTLQVAAHYVCRTRNHRPGAPVSEHGRGKAIDIRAVTLTDGTTLSVRDDWADSRRLRRAHKAACGIFGTTLGPGSDGMHEDHLHYDTARHRGGPYCR